MFFLVLPGRVAFFRRRVFIHLLPFLLGGFQIDEGQDHLAWLESLDLYSEVDFMLNDENTILIDIFIDI